MHKPHNLHSQIFKYSRSFQRMQQKFKISHLTMFREIILEIITFDSFSDKEKEWNKKLVGFQCLIDYFKVKG